MSESAVPAPPSTAERPLAGQVALVTGASRGIGRAIALELARRGAWIGVNYERNETAAAECLTDVRRAGSEGALVRFDVADAEAAARAVSGFAKDRGGRRGGGIPV
jgi:3-oxoacyl-[acyl-carrier protein] reductase